MTYIIIENLSMPEKESTSNTSSPSEKVDLNSLAHLSFGPSWADEKNSKPSYRKEFTENNKLWVRYVSPTPATLPDVINLKNLLDKRL